MRKNCIRNHMLWVMLFIIFLSSIVLPLNRDKRFRDNKEILNIEVGMENPMCCHVNCHTQNKVRAKEKQSTWRNVCALTIPISVSLYVLKYYHNILAKEIEGMPYSHSVIQYIQKQDGKKWICLSIGNINRK